MMCLTSAAWKLGLLATLMIPSVSTAVMPRASTRISTDLLPAARQLHDACQRECAGQSAFAQLVPSSQRLVQVAKQLRRSRGSAAEHQAQRTEARQLLDQLESGFRAAAEHPPISPTAETWDVHIGKGYVYFASTPRTSTANPVTHTTAISLIARCRSALGR